MRYESHEALRDYLSDLRQSDHKHLKTMEWSDPALSEKMVGLKVMKNKQQFHGK